MGRGTDPLQDYATTYSAHCGASSVLFGIAQFLQRFMIRQELVRAVDRSEAASFGSQKSETPGGRGFQSQQDDGIVARAHRSDDNRLAERWDSPRIAWSPGGTETALDRRIFVSFLAAQGSMPTVLLSGVARVKLVTCHVLGRVFSPFLLRALYRSSRVS